MVALKRLLDEPTRFLFFTGKGGVGKTSLSSATAIALADTGKRVLLVSTDPASNLSEVLATAVGQQPGAVAGADGLDALDIDPAAAAAAYRDRVVGPYRGILPDATIAGIEEQLSGACTVEIAAFDEFTGLLADPDATAGYDHVVFDTAPTGHTLRLLALPSAWTGFLDTSTTGVSCIGPLSGLTQAQDRYRIALEALADPAQTTLVLVTRPDTGAVAEAGRAASELRALGIANQHLILNGVFEASDPDDETAAGLERRHNQVLQALPAGLAELPSDRLPLLSGAPLGAPALRDLLDGVSPAGAHGAATDLATTSLTELADDMAATGHGLVMTMGKGGVGKTTIAAALAVDLARRGLPVTLSTTDPAAHVDAVLGDADRPADLMVERIDPAAATAAYVEEVLATAGADLDPDGLAVLDEDLRSPCTEEIAVFRAFAATVSHAAERIVVLDTAPTGHTLLLLDAAESYHRELLRHGDQAPPDVAALLDRLRDPDFTRVLIVTLPEPTPVHEAAALQADLERAGIRPTAWVVNQSLQATPTSDPILLARAAHEQRWLAEVLTRHASLAIVPWQPEPPVTTDALQQLVHGS
ncbi:MAG: arsenical pump-driving ATPase [Nitriliruptoraceae bacterium]